jgi:glycosyltransferase involved in cell wall biosynthesis
MARVAVCPYQDVFQSGAVMLAQSLGVPVVASRVGAMAAQVEDGVTGLLVPPGDDDALARALASLLTDEARAAAMGAAARRRAHEGFAWSRVAAVLCARYRELMGERGLPAAAAERARP